MRMFREPAARAVSDRDLTARGDGPKWERRAWCALCDTYQMVPFQESVADNVDNLRAAVSGMVGPSRSAQPKKLRP